MQNDQNQDMSTRNLAFATKVEHAVDYETDIYLFSPDLNWCIRYIDEFNPDNSRMTFLYSNEEWS